MNIAGGILTEPLSRLGGDITGLDCNVEMIKIATSRMQDKNVPNLRYILSAIEEYSTDNKNKYDVVVASETIEHVNEQDVFLKCCVECLKPGGSIFITTNSKSQCSKFLFITLLEDILSALPKGTHEYDMFIDIEEAKNLLRKEKCDVTFSSGIIYSPFNNRWYWIKNPYILHYGLHAIKSS
ncbi:hypothetical protein Zmor_011311 [Zophobas morio]|uniref:Methyltransferase type 11 domain-containing protein n=1 Tax=Zophobas morio TaxID=2755281 RepID=A0AA38MKT5_9CUCU|nr:hypothetical protein Zmor_011311 [Zophobas morio]